MSFNAGRSRRYISFAFGSQSSVTASSSRVIALLLLSVQAVTIITVSNTSMKRKIAAYTINQYKQYRCLQQQKYYWWTKNGNAYIRIRYNTKHVTSNSSVTACNKGIYELYDF